MFRQELGDFGFQFLLFVLQLVNGATPRLGRIGGEF
jgi:hypothetical protein